MLTGACHVRRADIGGTSAGRKSEQRVDAATDKHLNHWLCVTSSHTKCPQARNREASFKCIKPSMQLTNKKHAGASAWSCNRPHLKMQAHDMLNASKWTMLYTRMITLMQAHNAIKAGERIATVSVTDAVCPWMVLAQRPAPRVEPLCRWRTVSPPAGDETTQPKKDTNQ
jgi:hypothetical protein